jgi:hypothetical protein
MVSEDCDKVQGHDPRHFLRTQKKIYLNYCRYYYLKCEEDF